MVRYSTHPSGPFFYLKTVFLRFIRVDKRSRSAFVGSSVSDPIMGMSPKPLSSLLVGPLWAVPCLAIRNHGAPTLACVLQNPHV